MVACLEVHGFFCLAWVMWRYPLAGRGGGVKGGRYSCLPCRLIKKEEADLFDSIFSYSSGV